MMYNTLDTTKSVNVDLINNPMKYKDVYFYPPEGPGMGSRTILVQPLIPDALGI
jgi:hypothetical protein